MSVIERSPKLSFRQKRIVKIFKYWHCCLCTNANGRKPYYNLRTINACNVAHPSDNVNPFPHLPYWLNGKLSYYTPDDEHLFLEFPRTVFKRIHGGMKVDHKPIPLTELLDSLTDAGILAAWISPKKDILNRFHLPPDARECYLIDYISLQPGEKIFG